MEFYWWISSKGSYSNWTMLFDLLAAVTEQYHCQALVKSQSKGCFSTRTPPQHTGQMSPWQQLTTATLNLLIITHNYSLDLALTDLHVFLNLKKHLAGAHFTTDDDVVDAGEVCLNVLDKVPGISEYRFLAPSSKLCQNWLRRWRDTIYLLAAVRRRCQRPPKGWGTVIRLWQQHSIHVNTSLSGTVNTWGASAPG